MAFKPAEDNAPKKLVRNEYPDSNDVAVFDLDYLKFAAAAAGETRAIEVTDKRTGFTKTFKNRTEFYGRGKGKDKGYIGECNEDMEEAFKPLSFDEFEIKDVQIPDPIENVLHSAKSMFLTALDSLGTDKYITYLGKGASFRADIATLKEYKGNRKDTLRPLHMDAVHDYLVALTDATVVEGIECDDAVIMEAHKDPDNAVVVGEDKDIRSQAVRTFNPYKPEQGVVDCRGFGELWLETKINAKGKKTDTVRGKGRLHLYYQIISQDDTDNYKFNCESEKSWGSKSAYKVLVDCKNDIEAWKAMVKVAKDLYPEPKTITNFRGDDIDIDWLYVLQEMMDMARMLRFEGDKFSVKDALDKMGIDYE